MIVESKVNKTRILQINLIVALVGGIGVLIMLTRSSSEKESAVIFGYSPYRAALLAGVVALLAILGFVLRRSMRQDFWRSPLGGSVDVLLYRSGGAVSAILVGVSYVILFSSQSILGDLAPFAERLYPIALWLGLLALQISVQILFVERLAPSTLTMMRVLAPGTIVALILTMSIVLFIVITKIGLTPDADYWQGPGIPILFYQVMLACAAGMALSALENTINQRFAFAPKHADWFLCILLWVGAFLSWSTFPVSPSYGSLAPRPPNFQSYPFADALLFDINAQNYWIGISIPNDFWEKPFYSFFLALLHGIAGQNYDLLILLQVAVFALNPALLFLIVRLVVNRPAGLIAGVLLIFRELNGLSLSNVVLVSHTKLLMSDIFAMELILLLTLLLIYWIRETDQHRILPLIIGGVFGFLVLTRGHALLLIPFIALAVWLNKRSKDWARKLFEPALLFVLGLFLVLGVWVWRNYEIMGKFALQNPVSTYTTQIARLYSLNPFENPKRLPNETDEAYYDRIQSQPLDFLLEHPRVVAGFVSAHYFHNAIYSYLYLPQSLYLETPTEFVRRAPYWSDWLGELSSEARWFLLLNLLLLSGGIAVTWNKSRGLLALPLLLGIGYNLSVSIGRLSGWRLIQPVDWVTLIFYSAGLMQLAEILRARSLAPAGSSDVDHRPESSAGNRTGRLQWGGVLTVSLVLIGISLGLTKGQLLTRTRYLETTTDALLLEYRESAGSVNSILSISEVEAFTLQKGAIALHGRGLYPSYLPKDEGESNHFFLAFAPRPFKRLVFQLIGPTEIGVVLPLAEKPEYFPSGADVTVFGCYKDNPFSGLPGYVDALIVVVQSEPPLIYTRTPAQPLVCPFPEIN